MSAIERIEIDLCRQSLRAWHTEDNFVDYCVSTALNGPGEMLDSECTPRGLHEICELIGADCAPNTVFVGRRPTGELHSATLAAEQPHRDWILTRILWLSGREPGRNLGGSCDTRARYIYIHGTPDATPLGVAGSRGCVRMHNRDVIEVFDQVRVGTPVDIHE